MIIGLCGAAGAGKDTVAGHLAINHGFRVLAFASPLYEAVAAITGMTVNELRDRSQKEEVIEWLGKSRRELLQLLGTEFGRGMIRDDIWIRRLMTDVVPGKKYVITDVRFDNEAEAIREAGGVIIEVVRPGGGCLKPGAAMHSSEAGVDRRHITATVANCGTVRELAMNVDMVIARLHAATM
jgi:hypothetical protein